MKLLFKQRFFSWFDSYDIYGEGGETVYTVRGQLAWGHRLEIYNARGENIGTVQERIFTFLPRFQLFCGGAFIGEIRREFTFFRPVYSLDMNNWQVEGNLLGWDYRVTDGRGGHIMNASKQLFNWTDTYVIDVPDPRNALLSLMIVLAIDAANCSQK